MNTIKIKNVEIGKGIPKICIPLTGKNREEIIEEMEIVKKSNPDLIEWRVDFFEESDNPERVCEMLGTINDSFKQIPVLFTIQNLYKRRRRRKIHYVGRLCKAFKRGFRKKAGRYRRCAGVLVWRKVRRLYKGAEGDGGSGACIQPPF